MSPAQTLDQLMDRGCKFLGTCYAIMGGAMTWVSERNLVSATSNAGGFGILASGSMSPDLLRTEIQATQNLTSFPFGVNLITMHPELMDLIDVCIAEGVSHVVLAGGMPSKESITKLKEASLKVIAFAPALVVAKRLIKFGVDALVIEGMEAGGHIGPVATSILAQEILPNIKEVPVFVAGGIGRGEAIVSYLEMGAAGCQLGTSFVCAEESIAHPNFKQAFIKANARDAQVSQQLDDRFPVIPVRSIKNKAAQEFLETQRQVIQKFNKEELSQQEAQLEIEHYWAGALRRAVVDGDVDHGSLMAGQSVGMVNAIQPLKTIINELVQQSIQSLEVHKNLRDSLKTAV